jgi:ABC-2 type transport system ATP-binding protein
MAPIIEVQGLTKRYGKLTALDNLQLEVEKGAVVGFIGPNGAGKTTTMRILTTLLKPTAGEAWIGGYSVTRASRDVRRVIGYMPDFFGVYEDMKVWEYLDFFAACYDLAPGLRQTMIDDLLALVDLTEKRDEFVESLSRGMKQRLCLARTLSHNPEVLILDEPASGLDPRARIEMRELLRELKRMGKTIFFSSHILSEVADVCTSIAILEAGNLVAFGDMEEMKRRLRPQRLIHVRTLDKPGRLEAFLAPRERVGGVKLEPDGDIPGGGLSFDFTGSDEQLSSLLAELVRGDFKIVSFSEDAGDLEEVFMKLTRGLLQ